MKKMVILNITHGDNVYCTKKGFLPIAAGACRDDILTDACGEDNISYKNKFYGDFTSLYWAWKNLKNADIIGTSHYRRYIADIDYLTEGSYNISWTSFCNYKYSTRIFRKKLQDNDFILIRNFEIPMTIEQQYLDCHPYPENIQIVDEVLTELCPQYLPVWEEYKCSRILQFGFLFVTKWELFDGLCSWMYPILTEIEKRIDLNKYHGYQERVIAYIYERLVPVYIHKNKLRVTYMPMFFIENTSTHSINEYIKKYWYVVYRTKIRRPIVQCLKRIFRGFLG